MSNRPLRLFLKPSVPRTWKSYGQTPDDEMASSPENTSDAVAPFVTVPAAVRASSTTTDGTADMARHMAM